MPFLVLCFTHDRAFYAIMLVALSVCLSKPAPREAGGSAAATQARRSTAPPLSPVGRDCDRHQETTKLDWSLRGPAADDGTPIPALHHQFKSVVMMVQQ